MFSILALIIGAVILIVSIVMNALIYIIAIGAIIGLILLNVIPNEYYIHIGLIVILLFILKDVIKRE